MKVRIVLERFSLGLLVFALGGTAVAFSAFLAKETMRWAIFPDLEARFFHLLLPLLIGAVFVLSVFNQALNQGIQAACALRRGQIQLERREGRRLGALTLSVAVAFVSLTILVLYQINQRNISQKEEGLKREMSALVRENQGALRRLVSTIEARGAPEAVVQQLEALSSTSPSFRGLQLIYPVRLPQRTVYQILPRWLSREDRSPDAFYAFGSQAAGTTFAPNRFELGYLDAVTAREGGTDEPAVFVRRPDFRVFHPLRNAKGRTIVLLHSDDHTFGRKEYK